METNTDEIEQLLLTELQRLRKAVDYIEDAKLTASASANILAELEETAAEIQTIKNELTIDVSKAQQEFEKGTADVLWVTKSNYEAFLDFKSHVSYYNEKVEEKLLALTESNKVLGEKVVSLQEDKAILQILTFTSLLASLLALIIHFF